MTSFIPTSVLNDNPDLYAFFLHTLTLFAGLDGAVMP
jgi:hypothetical protein